MGLFSHSDGGDFPWPFDELVPGLAAERDDVVVGCENQVREPVLGNYSPPLARRRIA